jgi:hypothetical protein
MPNMLEQYSMYFIAVGIIVFIYILRALRLRHRRDALAYDTGHAGELLLRLVKREPNNVDYQRWAGEGNPTELYSRVIHRYSLFSISIGTKFILLEELCDRIRKLAQVDTYSATFAASPVADRRKIDEMNKLREKHDRLVGEIDGLVRNIIQY